jgi:LacI family transcriptional regulator
VLNGVRTTHVSEEKRRKILQAADELGYQAHPSARSLRKGQSDEICCISNAPPSFFSYEIHLSIQQQIFLHGYTPVFYISPGAPTSQWQETLKRIFARHPMGLILSQFSSMADDISLARHMGIEHIVLLSAESTLDNIPAIIFPISLPGYLAAKHLLERGHRHLGIVHPSEPILEDIFEQRLKGMHAAIAEVTGVTLDILPLTLSLPAAHHLVDSALTGPGHPTGIYAFNDDYALPLLRALTDRGVKVPQDVAIVGTDDLPFCEFVRPSLTSIRYDSEAAIGQRAVEMLLSLHCGQPLSVELSRPLSPQLIPRESS